MLLLEPDEQSLDSTRIENRTFPFDHFFFLAPFAFFDADWLADDAALAAALPCLGAMVFLCRDETVVDAISVELR